MVTGSGADNIGTLTDAIGQRTDHVAVGVPPVIQPVTDAPGTATAEAVERFDSWLKAFETPWRAG